MTLHDEVTQVHIGFQEKLNHESKPAKEEAQNILQDILGIRILCPLSVDRIHDILGHRWLID